MGLDNSTARQSSDGTARAQLFTEQRLAGAQAFDATDMSKYHFLFDSIPDIAYFIRLDGGIIEINNAAVNKYDYSKEELLAMNIADLRTDGERKKLPGLFTGAKYWLFADI